jgi:hypothetical protein
MIPKVCSKRQETNGKEQQQTNITIATVGRNAAATAVAVAAFIVVILAVLAVILSVVVVVVAITIVLAVVVIVAVAVAIAIFTTISSAVTFIITHRYCHQRYCCHSVFFGRLFSVSPTFAVAAKVFLGASTAAAAAAAATTTTATAVAIVIAHRFCRQRYCRHSAFDWLLSVTPAIPVAADVFVIAATAAATTTTATTATAVAIVIACRYCCECYCRHSTFGWWLSVTPAIAVAANVFVLAATTPTTAAAATAAATTATTATAVAVVIACRYCRQRYYRHFAFGWLLSVTPPLAVAANVFVVTAAAAATTAAAAATANTATAVAVVVWILGEFSWWKKWTKIDYPLPTKQACTGHACHGIVLQAMSRKRAEIAHGMTLCHPY